VQLNCTDGAGNVGGAAAVVWVVDEGPPKVRLIQTPEKHSHRRVAAFHLQAGEGDCTYEYRLDRKGWHSAQHGTDVTFDPQPREAHVSGALFTVRALKHPAPHTLPSKLPCRSTRVDHNGIAGGVRR
jgi:hypothetical protein